jgi:hypothetical protein
MKECRTNQQLRYHEWQQIGIGLCRCCFEQTAAYYPVAALLLLQDTFFLLLQYLRRYESHQHEKYGLAEYSFLWPAWIDVNSQHPTKSLYCSQWSLSPVKNAGIIRWTGVPSSANVFLISNPYTIPTNKFYRA